MKYEEYLKRFALYNELSRPYFDALCKLHAIAIPIGLTSNGGFRYDDATEELKKSLENYINTIREMCFKEQSTLPEAEGKEVKGMTPDVQELLDNTRPVDECLKELREAEGKEERSYYATPEDPKYR